jgi:hypothetical protein
MLVVRARHVPNCRTAHRRPTPPHRFALRQETGDYECQVCGWQYKEVEGLGAAIKPGTEFAQLPSSFA